MPSSLTERLFRSLKNAARSGLRSAELSSEGVFKVRNRFIVAPLVALACSLSALAQTQKLAVIDMQSALLGTKDGQKAAAELKAKFAPKEQELQKRQQELQSKQDQFRKTEN